MRRVPKETAQDSIAGGQHFTRNRLFPQLLRALATLSNQNISDVAPGPGRKCLV